VSYNPEPNQANLILTKEHKKTSEPPALQKLTERSPRPLAHGVKHVQKKIIVSIIAPHTPTPLAPAVVSPDDAIRSIVSPPVACASCYAERGVPFPPKTSHRTCAAHSATAWREQQLRRGRRADPDWFTDHASALGY